MHRGRHLLLAGSAIACAGAVQAGETVTYSYDSLGRLIRVAHIGTVNHGVDAAYTYDSADNRTRVTVSVPASTPPPPGNRPPVAVDESGTVAKCQYSAIFSPLLNDYDPDGPTLALSGASYSGGLGTMSFNNSEIRFFPNASATGTAVVTYSITDSLGATANATLSIDVIQGQCP
jgi:hypothetical protein